MESTRPSTTTQTLITNISSQAQFTGSLLLQASSSTSSHRVQWAEDVVDNEGMGKKSSKVCCIYHKPYKFDEDSSDSSDSDDEGPNAYERQPNYKKKNKCRHKHSNADSCSGGNESKPNDSKSSD
ncbi:hypothetical protein HK098_007573 [Nowakowskiella sp. JEL0407]|nr:hypothetical protein HK098_007573 [Nowakowskiella sp. JEL0407]